MAIDYGKITYHSDGTGSRWSCVCGDGSSGQSSGRRYPSFEECVKRAAKHLERCTFTYADAREEPKSNKEPIRVLRDDNG